MQKTAPFVPTDNLVVHGNVMDKWILVSVIDNMAPRRCVPLYPVNVTVQCTVPLALCDSCDSPTLCQASLADLVEFVRTEMAAYRLYTVVPRLVSFIEQLTNWYVRLNRRRLKGLDGGEVALVSLSVLYEVRHACSSLSLSLSLDLTISPFSMLHSPSLSPP